MATSRLCVEANWMLRTPMECALRRPAGEMERGSVAGLPAEASISFSSRLG